MGARGFLRKETKLAGRERIVYVVLIGPWGVEKSLNDKEKQSGSWEIKLWQARKKKRGHREGRGKEPEFLSETRKLWDGGTMMGNPEGRRINSTGRPCEAGEDLERDEKEGEIKLTIFREKGRGDIGKGNEVKRGETKSSG